MKKEQPILLGWREWIALPELGIKRIKAKTDTGARTSALHTFATERFSDHGRDRVRFLLHPLQRSVKKVLTCEADLYDIRWVSDSGGHREQRFVIITPVRIGVDEFPIEITLTNRDTMLFRMLLGRNAIKSRFWIDPSLSYLTKNK